MSSERLPALNQLQTQGTSSASSSPRGGSYASSAYNGSLSSATSYASSINDHHVGGPRTPPPEGTPHSYVSRDGLHDQHQSPYGQQNVNGFAFGVDYQNSMNPIGAPYNADVHQPHMATTHAHPPTSGPGLGHYQQPYQPPMLPSGHSNYAQTYNSYNYTGLPQQPPPSSMSMVPQPQLPAMSSAPGGAPALPGTQNYSGQSYDTTGQIAPPGTKPRVTATLWEDEGSLCFQVEAKGICVARREDNHMINGTKLLNVAGMTRGRRDGILKSEKTRHVVKIGPMHLKGVWIPFDRALDFANREKITDLLYPLFVHDIGALLYHPTNPGRTAIGAQGIDRRRNDQRYMNAPHTPQSTMPPHGMTQAVVGSVPPPPQSVVRPGMDRAHTFPTPPTSASSVMAINQGSGSYEPWGNSSIQNGQPLSIDTGLSNNRSVPTTPASTPPGNAIQGTPQYSTQSYESRPVYSTPAGQPQYSVNQNRYGNLPLPSTFAKPEMAPPAKSGEEEADHEADSEYTHTTAPYAGPRPSYSYNPNQATAGAAAPLKSEVPGVPDEIASSPHQNGSGRATPRTTTAAAAPSAWQATYSTPQRNAAAAPASSSLYNVVDAANGDAYAMHSSGSFPNGITGSKRARDLDDDEDEAAKRQKTESEGGPVMPAFNAGRPRAAMPHGRRAR